MKQGQVETPTLGTVVSDEQLKLINQYTRREFSKDEVYVFSLILCDNDVDRDFERFTVEALFELEKLFVGKTGIFDHEPKAKNQTARIFKCEVQSDTDKKTAAGDEYFCLRAWAYVPMSENTKDFILSVESGITKEVSVGFSAEKTVCSICSKPLGSGECSHIKGQFYGNKQCVGLICRPTDAYEFSFVAVPAQKNAGVVKSFCRNKKEELTLEKIIKSLKAGEVVELSEEQSKKLYGYICSLEEKSADGEFYRQELEGQMLRNAAIAEPNISIETMKSIAQKMNVQQLKEFGDAFKKRSAEFAPPVPQLAVQHSQTSTEKNTQFKI